MKLEQTIHLRQIVEEAASFSPNNHFALL